MRPVSALVLYRNRRQDICLEHWQIDQGKLRDPRPLSEDEVDRLAKALRKVNRKRSNGYFHGLIGPGTLFLDRQRMVFRVPAGDRTVFLERAGTGVPANKQVDLYVPEMVFMYQGPRHRVHAYWKVPAALVPRKQQKEDWIVGAPMPNITQGSVCLGTSMRRVKFDPDPLIMQKLVIRTFFGSVFNEWNHPLTGAPMARCRQYYTEDHTDTFWDPKDIHIRQLLQEKVLLSTLFEPGHP
jgi:hypothetical protein